jgi:hypothetical protein
MVWQLLNSALFSEFRGFAAVGKALDPEKVRHYRHQLASVGTQPEPAPVAYIHGTADRGYRPPFTLEEAELDVTLPAFTVEEMLERNAIPSNAPATTQLVPGGNSVTEVVVHLFEGTEAFLMATVINGGHNWPTPTTHGNPPVADHFDATPRSSGSGASMPDCPDRRPGPVEHPGGPRFASDSPPRAWRRR